MHVLIGDPPTRRVRRLDIQADMFLKMLQGMDGNRRVLVRGIPEDARTVGLAFDHRFNTVVLYVESDEFEAVADGALSAPLYPEFILLS
jgi:hypothetical protein